jgi:hypothetical protein
MAKRGQILPSVQRVGIKVEIRVPCRGVGKEIDFIWIKISGAFAVKAHDKTKVAIGQAFPGNLSAHKR